MENQLLLEINRIKTIMGIDDGEKIINSINETYINESNLLEERMNKLILLNESFGGGLVKAIDDIIGIIGKNSDEIVELGFKNMDELLPMIMKQDILTDIMGDIVNISKGIDVDPNTAKVGLVGILNNNKISKSVGEGWDDFITKIKNNSDYTDALKRQVEYKGVKMDLGEFLEASRSTVTDAYEEIEEFILKAVNDPTKNAPNIENGEEFVRVLREELGSELDFLKGADGEDIFMDNVESLFDKKLDVVDITPPTKNPKNMDDAIDSLKNTDLEDYGKFMKWFKSMDWSAVLRQLKELFLNLLDNFIIGGWKKRQTYMNTKLLPALENSMGFTKNKIIKKGIWVAGTGANVWLSVLTQVINISTAMVRVLFSVVTQIVNAMMPTIAGVANKSKFGGKIMWLIKALCSEVIIWISQAVYLYLYDEDGKKATRIWATYDLMTRGVTGFIYRMIMFPFRAENWVWYEESTDYVIKKLDENGYNEKAEQVEKWRKDWKEVIPDFMTNDADYKNKLKELKDCLNKKRNMKQSDADFVETQVDYEKQSTKGTNLQDMMKQITSKEDLLAILNGDITPEKVDLFMLEMDKAKDDSLSIFGGLQSIFPIKDIQKAIEDCKKITMGNIETAVSKEEEKESKKSGFVIKKSGKKE